MHAVLEYGLPKHIAVSKPDQSIMIVSSTRIIAIGFALFIFYSHGNFAVMIVLSVILRYVVLVGRVC